MNDAPAAPRQRFNGAAMWIITAVLYPLVLAGFLFTHQVEGKLADLSRQVEALRVLLARHTIEQSTPTTGGHSATERSGDVPVPISRSAGR